MYMTRSDLDGNYKFRIVHSMRPEPGAQPEQVYATVGKSMDGAVTPEEWMGTLRRLEGRLASDRTGRCDLQQLQNGLDVEVPAKRPGARVRYSFGSRCVRSESRCPCAIERAAAPYPPRYDEAVDRGMPRILIVDDGWPGADPSGATPQARAVWNQRIDGFWDLVRGLAYGLLFDVPMDKDAGTAAEEVTEWLFEDLSDGSVPVDAQTLANARDFWPFCVQAVADRCEGYARVPLKVDSFERVAEVIDVMQLYLDGLRTRRGARYRNPLPIRFGKPEARAAQLALANRPCALGQDGRETNA